MIRILDSTKVGGMLARRAARMEEAEATVRPILDGVRKHGDKVLMEYARKFDKLERKSVAVPAGELEAAAKALSPAFRSAVRVASKNILAFAKMQLPKAQSKTVAPGIKLGQIVRPLDAVAAYIPAGRYPLPPTLIIPFLPSQVAA